MIKPDAIEKGLVGIIEKKFLDAGLVIIFRTMVRFEEEMIFFLWPEIYGLEYIRKNMDFLVGHDLPIWILKGDNAIAVADIVKRALRREYSNSPIKTLVHCPDSTEEFKRNIVIFFNKNR